MRLYRYRLDIRACHPASDFGDRAVSKGVPTPHLPAFTEGRNGFGESSGQSQVPMPVHIRWADLLAPTDGKKSVD
jgi:hypothetical protein